MTDTPDPIDLEVGRRLAALRLSRGYNQSDLARSVGKTFQQIQKYEKGTNRVSASVLLKFARFLGVGPAYFFPEPEAEGGEPATPLDAAWATRQGQQLARLYISLDEDRRAAVLQCARALADPTAVASCPDQPIDEAA